MIESFNNIIFWVGYFSIIMVLLVIGLTATHYIHNFLMNKSKTYFRIIFNLAFEKRLENITKGDLLKWQEEQLEKWEKHHNKDSQKKEF